MATELIRSYLGSFRITFSQEDKKTRVALAALVFKHPHILLTDKPTNHLDIYAVKALALALNSFNGDW